MTYRNKMILLSALALLLLGTYSLGPLLTASDSRRLSAQPWLENVDVGSIAKIDFLNQGFSLIRTEGGAENQQRPVWTIGLENEEFPADSKKVEAFTERLANVAYYSKASETPDSWSKFSVDDRNGLKLKISTAMDGELKENSLETAEHVQEQGPTETIIFGESLQGSDRQYARKNSSDSTYVVDDLRRYLERESGYWADLALFAEKLSIQDVIAVEYISKEVGQFRFRRSEDGIDQIKWSLISEESGEAAAEEVDLETMNRHIRNLIELRAEKYATSNERTEAGMSEPHRIVSFETIRGNTYKLRIGNKNNRQQVYVRPMQSRYIYLVSQWRLNTVMNPLQELLPLQVSPEE